MVSSQIASSKWPHQIEVIKPGHFHRLRGDCQVQRRGAAGRVGGGRVGGGGGGGGPVYPVGRQVEHITRLQTGLERLEPAVAGRPAAWPVPARLI